MNKDLPLEILRCVECGESLRTAGPALMCAGCGEGYPVRQGTPRLLRRSLRERLPPGRPGGRPGRTPGDCDEWDELQVRTAASFGFEWQQFHELRAEWERNFLEYMRPRGPEFFRDKRVLDAGCGTGRHAYYAAKFGAEVVAVDLSDAIDVAARNTRDLDTVCTVQADLYDLPLAPESFDFIYSVGVLHHLPDPDAALANLVRYLKPGGEVQIYLYWRPDGQPVKRALLTAVSALRRITTRLPHRGLYWLSYPAAAAAYAAFVTPYRVLHAIPGLQTVAEGMPLRQYASYPFRVCVNDQFDRFSAPIERRYSAPQVQALLENADLEDISVLPNWGWLGTGRKRGAEPFLHPRAPSGDVG